jgi:hypothetical protein
MAGSGKALALYFDLIYLKIWFYFSELEDNIGIIA